jgi:hypothetical protein
MRGKVLAGAAAPYPVAEWRGIQIKSQRATVPRVVSERDGAVQSGNC